ncbi:porin [Vibrio cholerae]
MHSKISCTGNDLIKNNLDSNSTTLFRWDAACLEFKYINMEMTMKFVKSALILAMMTASANAATLVEKNGITFDMKGDFQVQLQKDNNKYQDAQFNFDSLELSNIVSYAVNQDVTMFGELTFDFSDAANKSEESVELKNALVGFEYRNMLLTLGKQDYASDEFGIAEDYEMASDDVAFPEDEGKNVILLKMDFKPFELILSTDLPVKNKDNETTRSFDAFAAVEVWDVELAAAYQHFVDEGDKFQSYGLSVAYDAGFALFAADYSHTKDDAEDTTFKAYNLATVFSVSDSIDIALGYVSNKQESEAESKEWYANATYHVPNFKRLSLFSEISRINGDDAELAYLAGVQMKF